MAKSGSGGFNGELVHLGAVRFRVLGEGVLLINSHSLDEASNTSQLPSMPIVTATNREPVSLANFIDQRIQVEVGTEEIDEWFEISKIVMFIRQVGTGYPQ